MPIVSNVFDIKGDDIASLNRAQRSLICSRSILGQSFDMRRLEPAGKAS